VIASSDEIAARPDAKPKAQPSFWERRANWYRIAEFEAALFCGLAALGLWLLTDLTDQPVAHRWMLHLGSEPAWIAGFAMVGALLLLAALSRPGLLRSAGLMAGITFFSGVAAAAIHSHAMPISSCAFVAHAAALAVSFWRRYE